ncbi:hypothetical protein [Leucobacter japonicus]|uniref:hypothetical protein n=1 Tax=Leucobacter japonicus TaxID=1461259 RepID=UPI0006A7E9D4|nr:hypothetical protein [Leucobacter japonicus]
MLSAERLNEIVHNVEKAEREFTEHWDLNGEGREYHLRTSALDANANRQARIALIELINELKSDLTTN